MLSGIEQISEREESMIDEDRTIKSGSFKLKRGMSRNPIYDPQLVKTVSMKNPPLGLNKLMSESSMRSGPISIQIKSPRRGPSQEFTVSGASRASRNTGLKQGLKLHALNTVDEGVTTRRTIDNSPIANKSLHTMYRSKEDLTLDASPLSNGRRLLKKRTKPMLQVLGLEPLNVDETEQFLNKTEQATDNTKSTDRLAYEVIRRDSNFKYTWGIS